MTNTCATTRVAIGRLFRVTVGAPLPYRDVHGNVARCAPGAGGPMTKRNEADASGAIGAPRSVGSKFQEVGKRTPMQSPSIVRFADGQPDLQRRRLNHEPDCDAGDAHLCLGSKYRCRHIAHHWKALLLVMPDRNLSTRMNVEPVRPVTVLFADLRGSMELLAERDPEDARLILDQVLERMIEAVH